METKHTPGPWRMFDKDWATGAQTIHADVAWTRHPESGLVCSSRTREEDAANALLIAAAPELFEALKAMRMKYGEYACEACDAADAAIAKATGA